LLDQTMTRADKRSNLRRWALGAILAIAVLLMLLGGLVAWQPAASLRAGLWLAGHDEVAFDQLRIGLHQLELTGLRIGGRSGARPSDHVVGRLKIDYRPRGLLSGRMDQVSVEGLTLRGRIDQDGFRLEGLDGAVASPDQPARLPALPMPDRVSVRDVRLELATPLGILLVPLAAELRPEQDRTVFVVDVHRAQLTAATGRLSAALHVEGEMPADLQQIALDPQSVAPHLAASGRVHLSAEALGLPGLADGVDGTGELAFVWQRGQLDASLSDVRAQLEAIAPEWPAIAALLPPPWQVELAQPAGISARIVDDGIRLEGSGQIALVTAGPQLDVALSTLLGLDADGRIRELVVADGEIDLRDLQFAEMRLERGAIQLQGAGSPDAWQGSLALDLAGAGAPLAGLTLDGATLQTGLDVRFADGRLSAVVREPGALQIAALSWADDIRAKGLAVRVQSSSAPLLSAELADGGVAWQQHVMATLPEFEVVAMAGTTPLRIFAQAEELNLELAGDRAGLDSGRIALSGGAVRAPAHEIRASGITAEFGLSAAGLDRGRPIPLSIASIVHEGAPTWFVPLRLDGSVQPGDDQVGFDVALGRTAGDVEMRVRGQHDLASGAGRAEVDVPPVEFAPGRLQPVGLVPALAGGAAEVSGKLALDGTIGWSARGDMRADLELLVEELAFSSGPARFAQVNGVIAFDRLRPLSTPPGQQLAIGLIDIGLPLTDGLLTFDLEPGQLIVEQLHWRFAEGRIRAAPFTIGSAGMRFSTTLTAERLRLDEIFALAQLDGLTGRGTMHGTLPITVAGTEAVIDNGELVSAGPGWVRYRPDQPPAGLQAGGESVNLLLQALENFRYEELRFTINGRTDAEMDVGLHISGANPELYGGYPIEFNLNLEGALAAVLRAGFAGYQIPERIRERMQGFGR
jgi:Dicarboxylate transport